MATRSRRIRQAARRRTRRSIAAGIPRLLPRETAAWLVAAHPSYCEKFPSLRSPAASAAAPDSIRRLQAFGDEWRSFPELHDVHRRIFD